MDLKKSALAWAQAILTQWQEADTKLSSGRRQGLPKKRRSGVVAGLSKKPKPRSRKHVEKPAPV